MTVTVWPSPHSAPISVRCAKRRLRLRIVVTAMTWSASVAWRMPSRKPVCEREELGHRVVSVVISYCNSLQLRRLTIHYVDGRARIMGDGRRGAARSRPPVDAPAPDGHRRPGRVGRPHHRLGARRALPRPGCGDDPVDRLPDARRPRGPGTRASRPWRRRTRSSTSCRRAGGHLHCSSCGQTWEIDEATRRSRRRRPAHGNGFEIDIGHVTLVGLCRQCAAAARA